MAAVSTILAATAIAVTAAGVGISVAGQRQQAKAAKSAADYNAAVERNNAILASQEAQYSADRIRKRNRILLSKQRATYAKGNVLWDATPDDVMTDSAIEGELDALAALYTGQVSATGARSRAQLSEMRGDAIMDALPYNQGATILTGVGSITGQAGNAAYRIEQRK